MYHVSSKFYWQYLRDPPKPVQLGTWSAFVVRVVSSFMTARLTFVSTYNKIGQPNFDHLLPGAQTGDE